MATVKPLPSKPCEFHKASVGKCKTPSDNGWCFEHEGLKCVSCKGKAVKSCDHGLSLVCGCALCGECKHTLINKGPSHVTGTVYREMVRKEHEKVLGPVNRLDPNWGKDTTRM